MTVRDHVMGKPDDRGRFGEFGGRFVPEALIPACLELEAAFRDAWSDDAFLEEFHRVLREFAGRPTPVTPLPRLSARLGLNLFAKREDLAHTGSHKINSVVGQTLLTKRMGKTRVIAETGAGQHGVATATAAARMGLACTVFMGEVDTRRQELNVFRMELLGATVVPVTSGSKTLKDAVNEAMREWVTCVADTHYCLGSVMGPHPFPWMVREFQSIIGTEAAQQLNDLGVGTPDAVVACVGGDRTRPGSFRASRRRAPAFTGSKRPAVRRSVLVHPASYTACGRCCCKTSSARLRKPIRSRPVSTTPGSVPSTRTSQRSSARSTSRSPTTR
jgi:tryptophan synthase beta chain